MEKKLKCGCAINEAGEFVIGKSCMDKNCGECRMIAQLHPFGEKRIVDMLFKI